MTALETSSQETVPAGFELLKKGQRFDDLLDRISRKDTWNAPGNQDTEVDVVDGFEDIIGKPLGLNFWTNTPGTVRQLAFMLSLSTHPKVQEIIDNENIPPREIIEVLRENRVLEGIKIIDLGCGDTPNLALAARALGAKVYTADVMNIDNEDETHLEEHIVVDFNQVNAIEILRDRTGGKFDLVSENLIGTTYRNRGVKAPNEKRVVEIGLALLKNGGYLDYETGDVGYRNTVLRKKSL